MYTLRSFKETLRRSREEALEQLDSIPRGSSLHSKFLLHLIRQCFQTHDFDLARQYVGSYLTRLVEQDCYSLGAVDVIQQSQFLFDVESESYERLVITPKARLAAMLSDTSDANGLDLSTRMEALAVMRRFKDLASLFRDPLTPRTGEFESHLAHLREVRETLGTHWHLADVATENELRRFRSSRILYQGRFCNLSSLPEGVPVLQFFFHTNFFRPDVSARFGVFERHNRFASMMLSEILRRRDVALLPRHQFNSFGVAASQNHAALSHHTIGGHASHWHYKESAFPGYFMLDPGGFSGWSSLAFPDPETQQAILDGSEGQARTFVEGILSRRVQSNASKYTQPDACRKRLPSKYVFLGMQLSHDQTRNLAFLDGVSLAKALIEHYEGSDTSVVIKRHPLCNDAEVRDFLKRAERHQHVVIADASIHELIAGAQAVFVVNSGLGLEAMLHGKPVVCSGVAEYAFATRTVKTAEELKTLLQSGFPIDRATSDKFIYYLFKDYYIEVGDDRHSLGNRLTGLFSSLCDNCLNVITTRDA